VTILQVWLLFGLPALLLGLALFIGRSPWRAALGYVVLLAGFATVAVFDRASGAVFGGILALLYAAGRGGTTEGRPELSEAQVEATEVPGMFEADRTLKPGQHA
jgi:hypothetical protein